MASSLVTGCACGRMVFPLSRLRTHRRFVPRPTTVVLKGRSIPIEAVTFLVPVLLCYCTTIRWVSYLLYLYACDRPCILFLHSAEKFPNLSQLCAILLPDLAPEWENFCIAVNFDDTGSTLKIIEKQHRGNPEDCCREVLMRWLAKERPTWLQVVDCLNRAKCKQLAKKVEETVGE